MSREGMSTNPKLGELVYATVPEFDALGEPHPGVRINGEFFGPGTHAVSKDLAFEINRIVASNAEYNIRILQPRRDLRSLRQVTNRGGGVSVDPGKIG